MGGVKPSLKNFSKASLTPAFQRAPLRVSQPSPFVNCCSTLCAVAHKPGIRIQARFVVSSSRQCYCYMPD